MTATVEPTVWAQIRAEIERRGWRQYSGPEGLTYLRHQTTDEWETGPCCLIQAVGAVTNDQDAQDLLTDRLRDRLRSGIGRWNDKPGRTVDDVYRLLDALDTEDRAA